MSIPALEVKFLPLSDPVSATSVHLSWLGAQTPANAPETDLI